MHATPILALPKHCKFLILEKRNTCNACLQRFVSQSFSFKTTFIASLGIVSPCNRCLVGFPVYDNLFLYLFFFNKSSSKRNITTKSHFSPWHRATFYTTLRVCVQHFNVNCSHKMMYVARRSIFTATTLRHKSAK